MSNMRVDARTYYIEELTSNNYHRIPKKIVALIYDFTEKFINSAAIKQLTKSSKTKKSFIGKAYTILEAELQKLMSKNTLAGRFLNDFFNPYVKEEFIDNVWHFRQFLFGREDAFSAMTQIMLEDAQTQELTEKYNRDISSLDFKSQRKEGIKLIREKFQGAKGRFVPNAGGKKTRGSRRAAGAARQAKTSAPRARKGTGGAQDVIRRAGPVERVERFKARVEGKIPVPRFKI